MLLTCIATSRSSTCRLPDSVISKIRAVKVYVYFDRGAKFPRTTDTKLLVP